MECFAFQDEWKSMGEKIGEMIENGAIKPIVDTEYVLENIGDAHEEVIKHASGGAKGKIVLNVSS